MASIICNVAYKNSYYYKNIYLSLKQARSSHTIRIRPHKGQAFGFTVKISYHFLKTESTLT